MTIINDTLARGLKDRLWNELDDLLDKNAHFVPDYQRTHKMKSGTRKGIEKLDHIVRLGLGRSVLAAAKCGSRASPSMRYAVFGGIKDSVNDWEEKTFHINDISMDAFGNVKYHRTSIRIGEHAVCRVFQRHPEIYNSQTKEFEIMKIIPEFQSLAVQGHLMYSIFKYVDVVHKLPLKNISVPFPSMTGIFLGSYNKEEELIDVRTFVADHQLSSQQIALAKVLREHLSENHSTMLPFILHQVGEDGFPDAMIAYYSALAKVAVSFSELVTWNDPDVVNKSACRRAIVDFLERFQS